MANFREAEFPEPRSEGPGGAVGLPLAPSGDHEKSVGGDNHLSLAEPRWKGVQGTVGSP